MRFSTVRKRLLPFAMAAVLLLLAVPVALAWPFGDVPAGHWAYNAIQRIAYLNISAGCGGGNYCPDDYVTRAQMAGFLKNMTEAHTDKNLAHIFSVDNQNNGSNQSGHGIIGKSYAGDGLQGASYGSAYARHGVYGLSNSTDSWPAGVFGLGMDVGPGVRAVSIKAHGVNSQGGSGNGDYGGYFKGWGGVWGDSTGSGPAGYFTSSNANGVMASADGASHYGVYAVGDDSYGVHGNTNVSGGYGLYTPDKIYTGGGCVGCTSLLIAQNGGDAPLEAGDVVAVVGIAKGPSESYARPVLLVRKADGQSGQGVVGVVEGRYAIEKGERGEIEVKTQYVEEPDLEEEGKSKRVPMKVQVVKKVEVEDAHTTTKPAGPGELLTVVYRGIVQVKVDAASGAIQVGDLLVSASGASGRAMKASAAEGGALPTGAIIGKALEPLAKGQQLIWVLVDLQ